MKPPSLSHTDFNDSETLTVIIKLSHFEPPGKKECKHVKNTQTHAKGMKSTQMATFPFNGADTTALISDRAL